MLERQAMPATVCTSYIAFHSPAAGVVYPQVHVIVFCGAAALSCAKLVVVLCMTCLGMVLLWARWLPCSTLSRQATAVDKQLLASIC